MTHALRFENYEVAIILIRMIKNILVIHRLLLLLLPLTTLNL